MNYGKIFNDLFIANLLLSVMVKNFEDRLGFGKVTAKNQVAPFFRTRCRCSVHKANTSFLTKLARNKATKNTYAFAMPMHHAERFFAAKCRRRSRLPYFGCFSRYCWGSISQNINVATPNLVSLMRPSVPIVLPNSIDIC